MSRLLKFDDFERNKPGENKIEPSKSIDAPKPAIDTKPIMQRQSLEESMRTVVWKGIMESTYFSDTEKTGIYMAMKAAGVNKQALNESILTRMREALPKLKADGGEVQEVVIDKLEKVMKSAGSFSKYLADLVLKAWDRALGFYKTKLEPSKVDVYNRMKQLRRDGKDLNNNIANELVALKDISMFWLKTFPGLVAKALLQNYSKAILKESLEVSADIHKAIMKFNPSKLNEENNELWAFMDEITDQLKNAEPFKSIAAVRSFEGVSPDKFSEAYVKYTADAGGPAVKKFEMLPYVMEDVVTYKNSMISKDIKDNILGTEGVLKFLPMNKEILTIIEGLAVTVVSMEAMMKIKDDLSSVYKKQ